MMGLNCIFEVCLVIFFCMHELAGGMDFLPGSCVAAGYTECCNGDIDDHCGAGIPATCYCDPSCMEHGDCCSDIHLICNPDRDAALKSLRPVIKYLDSITFHTATLHWITVHNNYSLNGTYLVSLLRRTPGVENFNTSLEGAMNYSLSAVISRTGANDLSRKYGLEFSDLEEGAEYIYKISAVTDIGNAENLGDGSITTRRYPNITVDLELAGASFVHVTWLRPEVPVGVAILQYNVYYRETLAGGDRGFMKLVSSPSQTSAVILNLNSHRSYSFQVAAVVQKADGRIYEFRGTGNDLEVFVPDTALFQLVMRAPLACEDWNMQFEEDVTSLLRSMVINSLQEDCSCGYPKEYIQAEALTLVCISEASTQITYRADLLSVAGHTVQKLIDSIEAWVNSSSATLNTKGSSLTLIKLQSCPVRIDYRNAPICRRTQTVQDCEVTVEMLVAFLVTEFVLMVVIFIASALVVAYFSKAKRKRYSIQERDCHQVRTVMNSYSSERKMVHGAANECGKDSSTAPTHPNLRHEGCKSEPCQHQRSLKYIL